MPSRTSSAGSTASAGKPPSGPPSRTSSAGSSVVSLRRLLRSGSASSAGSRASSLRAPSYSPIEGIFKSIAGASSQLSTPRGVTPAGHHLLPKYASNAPPFSPALDDILDGTDSEGPASGAVSRTTSAGSLPPSVSANISRTGSASSVDSTLPPVVFESTSVSGAGSKKSSPAISRNRSAESLPEPAESLPDEPAPFVRTRSSEKRRRGPEGWLVYKAREKIKKLNEQQEYMEESWRAERADRVLRRTHSNSSVGSGSSVDLKGLSMEFYRTHAGALARIDVDRHQAQWLQRHASFDRSIVGISESFLASDTD